MYQYVPFVHCPKSVTRLVKIDHVILLYVATPVLHRERISFKAFLGMLYRK